MPLYEFRCEKCDYFFEKLVASADEVSCPVCGGHVKKLLSTFSIEIPDEACAKLDKGEKREICMECKHGGGGCPFAA